ARRATIFVDYLVLRSPGQKGDKVPRILKLRRTPADPPEETPPDALKEVQRVETRTQQPRELPAHHQPDFGLVPRQELSGRVLVPRADSLQERRDVVAVVTLPVSDGH